jgi:Protein of unknown function (DUF2569)
MYCQRCGTPEINGVCPRCGSVGLAPGLNAAVPGSEKAEPQAASKVPLMSSAKPAGGVMGWLLLLCLSLTIFAPFVQGRIAWTALRNLATTSLTNNGTIVRLSTVGAIYAGLSIFSFCAGLLLWLEEPRGVSVAKAYMWIAPTLVIPLYTILALAGLRVDLLRVVVGRLAYSVVWYAYLSTSRRVRETYFRPTV